MDGALILVAGAALYKVMSFPLPVKNGAVLLSGTPKTVKEGSLQAKFGGEEVYAQVKSTMQDALNRWSDSKDELDRRAFRMYEKFRPTVPPGERGWGRKGELNLAEVDRVIVA